MKRKKYFFLSLSLLLLAIAAAVFMSSQSSTSKPMTFNEAQRQARSQDKLPECLELSSQNIPAKARDDITKVVGAKLTDLPHGMLYGVYFKTYSPQKATGTIIYDGEANTFNYTVDHKGDTWKLSKFEACTTY